MPPVFFSGRPSAPGWQRGGATYGARYTSGMAGPQQNHGDGWQFAIDVGGTFTDCVARDPQGGLHSVKLLSTGAYRGRTAASAAAPSAPVQSIIVDPLRASDPIDFFAGWELRIPAPVAAARPAHADDSSRRAMVSGNDAAGRIHLSAPFAAPPPLGAAYELTCNLEGPVIAIRRILGLPLDQPLGAVHVRLGTTRGTNALLERRGGRTAFVTTAGFADVLRIGNQARPRLFDLHIRKPAPLYEHVIEVDERIDAAGRVLRPLDRDTARAALIAARDAGIEAVAICLLHSYRNATHERALAEIAVQCGFLAVSSSSGCWPLQRIVPRGETTVVDAYLTPVIRDYVERIWAQLGPAATLRLMTSAGDLAPAESFAARDSVLSGPAGGVVATAHVARSAGCVPAIGFDMGGTSTDVSRFGGAFERRYETILAERDGGGTRIVAPLLAIETVAAGGGSICDFDGARPTVGPHSAGAAPGPACYGGGGPLCVTDANVYLGRISAAHFPFPLDTAAVEQRLTALAERIERATGRRYALAELALGYVRIADSHMAAAIREVSIRRGHDPRAHALICFGGAGGQHCCAVARELGISRVIVPRLASLLSAYGIGLATPARIAACDLTAMLDAAGLIAARRAVESLEADTRAQLQRDGVTPDRIAPPRRMLDLRYAGQDVVLTIDEPADDDWRAAFESAHERLYGFRFAERAIEIRAAHVELREAAAMEEKDGLATGPRVSSEAAVVNAGHVRVWTSTGECDAPRFERDALAPDVRIAGPALIVQSDGVVWLAPGWDARLDGQSNLVLSDTRSGALEAPHESQSPGLRAAEKSPAGGRAALSDASRNWREPTCDPVTLELFANAFASIATQMGATLQRTALSTNVKERLDFSCAVFDGRGNLVAHAPHIPVHLGAMGQCVQSMLAELSGKAADAPDSGGGMRAGEVYVTNDPYRGGSHLPDVTVITPVFLASDQIAQPAFYVASRAHHAEIGGISPGSMPPHSRKLGEEGVLIPLMKLVAVDEAVGGIGSERARFCETELRQLLTGGPHPSRSPDQNIADLRAQVAANHIGVELLRRLAADHGRATVSAYMRHLQNAAARQTQTMLREIGDGTYRFADMLDDGTPVQVVIEIRNEAATFDFTGTGGVHPGNLNATPAIVASAVLYCLRCLIGRDVPLNAGILAPVKLVVPPGLLNPPIGDDPTLRPAVVGGNVETSQRLVDVIFGALGVVAASQGTMNNLAFGDAKSGYYETIGGGAGAGPTFDGADAVHVHMTNTRLTDPEVLEERYPVRLRQFAIRRGSGGAGAHRGGDGIIREIEFLAPLQVSLLTQRRTRAPFGLAGGAPGAAGVNTLVHRGTAENLGSSQQIDGHPGDVLRIETPGGGGFGAGI